uniref:Uncharacterized protein n=1 Tax=Plectus sambesii TaxID=2011161 RepID=A0A914V9V8_9BILA
MLIPSAIFALCLAFTSRSEAKAFKQQSWEYQPGPAWYQAPKPAPAPYPQTAFPQPNNWNKPADPITNNFIPQLPSRPSVETPLPQPTIEEQRAANDFITALKSVFNKFSTNLDQSGLHEDVSHMTHQLQQTWDDLKRGQMSAHLEKLFNKAQQMVVNVNDS